MYFPRTFQAKIVQRFLDDKEFEQFTNDYSGSRHREVMWRWVPTAKDWKIYRNLADWTDIRQAIETTKKQWGVKDTQTFYRRVGLLALLEMKNKRNKV